MKGCREARNTSSIDNIQLIHYCFVTYRKKLKEAGFIDKEFLYKKITTKMFMQIVVSQQISQKMHAVKQHEDLTALN